ncbi:hypothetical protein CIL05_07835 [Virgibacillus profundi]|uniref:HNH nuclease domain-containing protein n=1 Tax=Virgibacillus profundi TaxID=2024555 RepID=A0A2A2IFX6_9BACI|nr:hypothetical protein CIL05_07835 [Virgibacillus profundi]PXY54614.1 Fis family transcriptional regulator [Virgibacillus profundi]
MDLLHRIIKNPQEKEVVDHINHNTLDNVDENLRVGTRAQNTWNSRMKSNNTSGVIGVYSNSYGRWVAEIYVNGKKISLGNFDDIEEAKKVRRNAEYQYFKEFALEKQGKMKHE